MTLDMRPNRKCQSCEEIKDKSLYFTMAFQYCDVCSKASSDKGSSNVLPIQRKCVACAEIKERSLNFTTSHAYCDPCSREYNVTGYQMPSFSPRQQTPSQHLLQPAPIAPSVGTMQHQSPITVDCPDSGVPVVANSQCQVHDGTTYASQDGLANGTPANDEPAEMILRGADISQLSGETLPEGVNLASLACQGELNSAPEAYASALEELGGEEHLTKLKDKMQLLHEIVARNISDFQIREVTQHHGWSSFELGDFLHRIASEELREPGVEALQKLQNIASCIVQIAKPKGSERSQMKVDIKYGGDLMKLVDVNRATVICETTAELLMALQTAVFEWCTAFNHVVELEDHYFDHPMQHGYRHVQLLVNFGGVLWEVQFNTAPFIKAKKTVGHRAYKTLRYVKEMALYYCMKNEQHKLEQLLNLPGVEHVMDVNFVRDKWGHTALHYAAFYGNVDIVNVLLQWKADVWAIDHAGQLPIQHAAVRHCWEAAAAIVHAMELSCPPSSQLSGSSLLVSAEYSLCDGYCQLSRRILMCGLATIDVGQLFRPPYASVKCTEAILSMLKSLNLKDTKIQDEGVGLLAWALATNTTVTSLSLASNDKMGLQSAELLAEVLRVNTVLAALDLGCTRIGSEGVILLAQALQTNAALTYLNLRSVSIYPAGAQVLAQVLQVNTTLASLNLQCTFLRNEGCTMLAEVLKTNSTLTSLDLGHNMTDYTALDPLVDALSTNTTLTSLNLESYFMGGFGMYPLAQVLQTNTTLTHLDLQNTYLGTDGAKALAEALMTNTTLLSLAIQRNNIGDEGAKLLAEALQTNTTLVSLDIRGNGVGDEVATLITQALQANATLVPLNGQNDLTEQAAVDPPADALLMITTLPLLDARYEDINDVEVDAPQPHRTTAIVYPMNRHQQVPDSGILPEGVDLDSLATPALSHIALDAYSEALTALGGEDCLGSYGGFSGVIAAATELTQHHGYSSFPLPMFVDDISSDIMQQYGAEEIQRMANDANCEVEIAKAKGLERSQMKVDIKYGGDLLKLVDVNRATIACDTTEHLRAAVSVAQQRWSTLLSHVVELDDHFFNHPMQHGYRHVQLVINFRGVLWEVQFNTVPFISAKKTVGHQVYKTLRYINEMVLYHCIYNDIDRLSKLFATVGPDCQGFDVNLVRDKWGRSALHYAAFHGNGDIVDMLLAHDADVFAMDALNQLPIQQAVMQKFWPVAAVLAKMMEQRCENLSQNTFFNAHPSLVTTIEHFLSHGHDAPFQWMLNDIDSLNRAGFVKYVEVFKQAVQRLDTLELPSKNLGAEAGKLLAQVLQTNTSLSSLNIKWNAIGDEGIKLLSQVLLVNTTLTSLNLESNNIGLEGMKALAKALLINTTLRSLDMPRNVIGNEGIDLLAQVLQTNPALTSMDLAGTFKGPEGLKPLARVLEANNTLTALDIRMNELGDEGMNPLAQMLQANTTLTSLILIGNAIGDAGMQQLAQALRTNTTLATLFLEYNDIGSPGAQALAQALESNTTLTSLGIEGNDVGWEETRLLAKYCASSPY